MNKILFKIQKSFTPIAYVTIIISVMFLLLATINNKVMASEVTGTLSTMIATSSSSTTGTTTGTVVTTGSSGSSGSTGSSGGSSSHSGSYLYGGGSSYSTSGNTLVGATSTSISPTAFVAEYAPQTLIPSVGNNVLALGPTYENTTNATNATTGTTTTFALTQPASNSLLAAVFGSGFPTLFDWIIFLIIIIIILLIIIIWLLYKRKIEQEK